MFYVFDLFDIFEVDDDDDDAGDDDDDDDATWFAQRLIGSTSKKKCFSKGHLFKLLQAFPTEFALLL